MPSFLHYEHIVLVQYHTRRVTLIHSTYLIHISQVLEVLLCAISSLQFFVLYMHSSVTTTEHIHPFSSTQGYPPGIFLFSSCFCFFFWQLSVEKGKYFQWTVPKKVDSHMKKRTGKSLTLISQQIQNWFKWIMWIINQNTGAKLFSFSNKNGLEIYLLLFNIKFRF